MTQDTQHQELKVILHAPTPAALERARSNAANLRREVPEVDVRIIVNAQAVAAALDVVHTDLDALTWVCPNTLARSEEHTSELQSLMRISYAVFCLQKKNKK